METSSNNHCHERVFVSWKRTDITQNSNNTFYYKRFSISKNISKESMGRFRIQLLLKTIFGAHDITYLKIDDIVTRQLNGQW